MTRNRMSSLLVGLAAAGFFATAAIHSTGYDSVTALAAQGPADVQALMPALWLAFSFDLIVIGLILGVVAFRPARSTRLVVAVAALCPLCVAALQIRYIGFIVPTAILLGLSALTLIAASVIPSNPDSSKERMRDMG
jgi:cell division protein FtsW (lipid II flippase)